MAEPTWDPRKGSYTNIAQSLAPGAVSEPSQQDALVTAENQQAVTGIYWDRSLINVTSMKQGGTIWARERMRARLPELIWSTAALEGNTFTLPEVKTLLDGVTVEGKKIEEEQQVLALQETFNRLDELVASESFHLDQSTSDGLHAIVARHEAIESGHFRGLGSATGGGNVRLTTGDTVAGLPSDQLANRFTGIVNAVGAEEDKRLAALTYFAAAIRAQFYFDGNKRTARMMASGVLMQNGYEAVYIPFERRLEYNRSLDELFTTNNATALMSFIASCAN
jgi:Fic family protein